MVDDKRSIVLGIPLTVLVLYSTRYMPFLIAGSRVVQYE